jgi:serine phosphatase RsbU (regulator of sigma subunit)/PAS domain-containing protein
VTAPEPDLGSPGERIAAVRRLESTALGSRALQRLTGLAARLLDADAAAVSLLGHAETVVSGDGLPSGSLGRQVPLAASLCAATLAGGTEPLVARDTARDPRVAALPPVADGRVGGYVGVPLVVFDGSAVGTLAVYTRAPRLWADSDVALLRQLGDAAATELELSALSREFEAHRLRFELAIDAAEIGSFDWDLASGRLVWDDRMVEIFAYDRQTFDETIESFSARLHPDDRDRTLETVRTALESCGEYDAEYRIVLPPGETRWVQARGRVVADDDGRAARFLGAAFDTTRQHGEEARVARVLESMNAAFFALDRDWRFDYVNAEAERLLVRPRDELLGGSIWERFPDAVGTEFEDEYRAAVASGRERVFEAYFPPLQAWYEVRAWPSPDGLSVYFIDVSERRAAEEQARRGAARLSVIARAAADVSDALAEASGEAEAVRRLTRAVVPVLGDWVIASLVGEDGRLVDVASWHADAGSRELAERYSRLRLAAMTSTAPIVEALRSGQPMIVDDLPTAVGRTLPAGEVRDLFEALAPRTGVALSLLARGRTVGALSIYRSGDRPPADADDVATMREVADRVALALDSSRLYEQQRRLAEGLQRSLLTAPPEPDHAEIVVRYRPAMRAAEVGGDWYDAFLQPSGATVVVIGDVVGHDTEAAAAMGQLRGMLRGIAYRDGAGPASVLTELDAAIQGLGMNTMATAAIARVEATVEERAAGVARLRWSNAGHPPPLLIHPDGRIQELSTARAELMLGVDPATARTESVATVRRGTTLFLYTDGLVEGRDLPLDDGIARLKAVLAERHTRPLGELCDEVIERLRPEGLQDDVALVAIRLHPEGGPRPPEAGPERLPDLVRPRRSAED